MNRFWWIFATGLMAMFSGNGLIFGQVYHARFLKQQCKTQFCQQVEESGSAVCLGELDSGEWLLVTVAHGTEEALRVDIALPNEQGEGEWIPAKVITTTHDNLRDLSLIKVKSLSRLNAAPLDVERHEVGSQVELAGFPVTGFRRWHSKLRSANTVTGMNRQGESGGAVLFNGGLIGIQWGHSPSEQATYFTPSTHIKTMVDQHVRLKYVERKRSTPIEALPLQPLPDHSAPLWVSQGSCQSSDCEKVKSELKSLNMELQKLKEKIAGMEKQNEALSLKNRHIEDRLTKLEPLLKRRVILETESGDVTADRIYSPEEAIRLRSIFRSQVQNYGNSK